MINSQMTLNFAYTLYLMLNADSNIPKTQIKKYVQKWYVLSVLTGRYVNSPESAMDRDIRNIEAKGFLPFFEETESAVLSDSFWKVGLVQSLETSAINSPYFITFLAVQVYLGDDSLFMQGTKVGTLISMIGMFITYSRTNICRPTELLKGLAITRSQTINIWIRTKHINWG